MNIIHTGDWHVSNEMLPECQKVLNALVESAEDEHPDLIVITGDIYETRYLRQETEAARLVATTITDLMDLAPVVCILGTPSHDGQAPLLLRSLNQNGRLYVADRAETVYLIDGTIRRYYTHADDITYPEAAISLAPAFTKQYFAEDIKDMAVEDADKRIGLLMNAIFANFGQTIRNIKYRIPHILVGHWTIGGAFISETQQLIGHDIEIHKDQIKLAMADLVCLGHIHYSQQIDEIIFYNGSLYRHDFGEMDEKGFWYHELRLMTDGDVGIMESKFIKTPTRRLVRMKFDVTKDDHVGYSALPEDDLLGAWVRIDIKCWIDQDVTESLEMLAGELKRLGAEDVKTVLTRMPRASVRGEGILSVLKLSDKVFEFAGMRNDVINEEILVKADKLELYEPDDLIKEIVGGDSQ